ncbi:MAG TPA: hypothetical protein VGF81_01770 [Solirubrobacteraceae bacterium]
MISATVWDWLYNAARWPWHDPDGYNFISGPLADITLLGAVYAILRRHNCHVRGCWRLGRHQVAGTTYVVCRKHHPDESPSADDVLAAAAVHKHALAARREVVTDVRHVAHEVAADVHEVAEDVHKAGESLEGDSPPKDKGG